jgi:hypothetical protein
MLDATPLLRLYARWRLAQLRSQDPIATQELQLLKLVRRAASTRFGQDHDFSKIGSVKDFQERVPIRTYEMFWNDYWSKSFPKLTNLTWPGTIPWLPVTSGTSTGRAKYIPCSWEMISSNKKAGFDLLTYHAGNRPNTKIFGGRSFMLGGTTDLVKEAPGIFSGDLSGIAVKTMPCWIRPRYFPPQKLALLKDWEKKIDIFSRLSLQRDIRMISGVPAWLLILFDKISKTQGGSRIVDWYPNLEMLVHGGVNFTPYYQQFKNLLEGSHAELREVYSATEGFVGVADRGFGQGFRMSLDHGIFYEFIPVDELSSANPRRHWIGNIELDLNYVVVLTTCAGLWSYSMTDTVKFVERNPARLLITGRTAYQLSAFGEHLIDEEIEDAVSGAAQSIGRAITDYSVGALFPQSTSELGGHLYIVEFSKEGSLVSPEQINQFASAIDRRLIERNEDYESHRSGGFGLNPPKIEVVKPGTFTAWMKQRGKLGGQNKVPRVITDRDLFDNLRQFCGHPR